MADAELARLVAQFRHSIPALPAELMDEAIHAASELEAEDERDQVLAALALRLAALGREATALDVIEAISDDDTRSAALAGLPAAERGAVTRDLDEDQLPVRRDVQRWDSADVPIDPSLFPEGEALDGEPAATRSTGDRPAPVELLRTLIHSLEARAREVHHGGHPISSGFAPGDRPAEALAPDQPLRSGRRSYFWLALEPAPDHTIDALPAELPSDLLPEHARLTVGVFGFPGELQVVPGQDIGELQLDDHGAAHVIRQAAELGDDVVPAEVARTRLLFPVNAPAREGTYRLRCNIYYRDTLVQSRVVTAKVRDRPEPEDGALRADIDYQLSRSLRPRALAGIEPHSLSVLLGSGQDRSHSFCFFGAERFKSEAVLDGELLSDLVTRARQALRRAAWGSTEPWRGHPYRYDPPPPIEQLERDLIDLAICGYRLYDALIDNLAGGYEQAMDLAERMRTPGQVQVVLRRSPRLVVPVAVLYDQGIDTNAPRDRYTLCREFTAALDRGEPLIDTACFTGPCPHLDDPLVICPSGFWGYRHALGLPVATGRSPHAPIEIRYGDSLELSVAVSTDPALTERPEHEQRLRRLLDGAAWSYAASRDEALRLLKEKDPHLVYFYCHGGLADEIPYIQVGSPDERGITRDNLRLHRIRWAQTRPLVFLNGCHTTALRPEVAMDLVSAFVESAAASGVIGTEITVFEPLACAFAEAFYDQVTGGLSIGEAVRAARLSLLQARNPLGLVYIPYVLASARLQKTPRGSE